MAPSIKLTEWLAKVKEDGLNLSDAPPVIQATREIALAAVREDGRALKYVASPLQADRELVLAAVRQTGQALEHAAAPLRADFQVVCTALENQPSTIKYAAQRLMGDRRFVTVALARGWLTLSQVAKELQSDFNILNTFRETRLANERAEAERVAQVEDHYAALRAALRKQQELAELFEEQRTPQDLSGMWIDGCWVAEILLNRGDLGSRDGFLRYKFVRDPESPDPPPAGTIGIEKLLGKWENDIFLCHGVSVDVPWLAPTPAYVIRFNGERCDVCSITSGDITCELKSLTATVRPQVSSRRRMNNNDKTARARHAVNSAMPVEVEQRHDDVELASLGNNDTEVAIRRGFVQAASQLSEEDLRVFIHDHVGTEIEAIRKQPKKQRLRHFRMLCFQWHPDKCPGMIGLATEIFQTLQQLKDDILDGP